MACPGAEILPEKSIHVEVIGAAILSHEISVDDCTDVAEKHIEFSDRGDVSSGMRARPLGNSGQDASGQAHPSSSSTP